MRTVAEYNAKALEFDGLALTAPTPELKKRYADLAECFRLLADERERLVVQGVIPMDPLPKYPAPK